MTKDRTLLLGAIRAAIHDAWASGLDLDELIEEAKRTEVARRREDAFLCFFGALRQFRLAAQDLARAWENEYVDQMAIAESYPEGWPSFKEFINLIRGMRELT